MVRVFTVNDSSDHIFVSFPYDPLLVAKVKTIEDRRWHPVEKRRSFQMLYLRENEKLYQLVMFWRFCPS
jgi:hypothetical protein